MKTIQWLSCLLTCLVLSACSGGGGQSADGGVDGELDGSGDGSQGPVRELVDGTLGFCLTSGTVDDSCESVADCVGYRVPYDFDCCARSTHTVHSGCAFANRNTFVDSSQCTADEGCRAVPRDCVAGRCVATAPELDCTADKGCLLLDNGCNCLALSEKDEDFEPHYGMVCDLPVTCQRNSAARCVSGLCVLSQAVVEPQVQVFCDLCADWLEPGQTSKECVDKLLVDGELDSILVWYALQSLGLADTCEGLMTGPLSKYLECLTVLCP